MLGYQKIFFILSYTIIIKIKYNSKKNERHL